MWQCWRERIERRAVGEVMSTLRQTLSGVMVLIGAAGVAFSVFDLLQSFRGADALQAGSITVAYREGLELLTEVLVLPIRSLAHQTPWTAAALQELGEWLPSNYGELVLPSAAISLGYLNGLRWQRRQGILPSHPHAAWLGPIVAVVIAVTLLGWALLASLIKDSLKSPESASLLIRSLYFTASYTIATGVFVLLNITLL